MACATVFMSELTLGQVDQFLAENDLILIPTGSTEQHGPHSPLSTDVIIPTEVCRRVGQRVDALVAPAIPYGISSEHRGFGGLAYLNAPTFISVVEDVAFSLAEAGFRRIVFVNGHYPNYHPINIACRNVSTRVPAGTRAWGVSYWDALPPEQLEEYLSLAVGMHANVGETSAVMAVRPELVDLDAAVEEWPDFPDFQAPPAPTINAYFGTHAGALWRALRSGVWGDPRGSTVESGEKFYAWIEEGMVKLLADVDETFRRLDVRS